MHSYPIDRICQKFIIHNCPLIFLFKKNEKKNLFFQKKKLENNSIFCLYFAVWVNKTEKKARF